MELKEVAVDEIEAPTRSEKLHPYENEDPEEWEQFKGSIENELQKPLEVTKNGDGYELIDGDRRLRAAKEVDRDTVPVFIRNGEVPGEADKIIKMITANEYREPSDKKQRARQIAQISAPWLLPPGERIEEIEADSDNTEPQIQKQTDVADQFGKSDAAISLWLEPVRDEYPFRTTLADMASGQYPTGEDVERIDTTVDKLTSNNGHKVVTSGDVKFTATELADMRGVSLKEIQSTTEKAVDEGWDNQDFLEYLEKNFAFDEVEDVDKDEIDAGMLGNGSDPFEDDSEPQTNDTLGGAERADPLGNESASQETTETEDQVDRFTLEPPTELDWDSVLDESDLELDGDTSIGELEQQRMLSQTLENDAAVMVNIIAESTGRSKRDVMKDFIEPLIVDQGIKYIKNAE